MTTLTKVLIGAGIVCATAVTAYVVTKKPEVVKTVDRKNENGDIIKVQIIEKGDSILDKIKKAAIRKAFKIITWAYKNQMKIEVAGALIGLAAGVFKLINEIRGFKMGKDIYKKLGFLEDGIVEQARAWNHRVDTVNGKFDGVMNKLNDIHLDMGIMHQIQEMLVKPKRRA